MKIGMSQKLIWLDDDLLEVQFRASNGNFSAVANFYEAHDLFSRLADEIQGFPVTGEDRRAILIGTLDPENSGGGARLVFRCVGRSGAGAVEVVVRSDAHESGRGAEAAAFAIPVQAAVIDRFVADLRKAPRAEGSLVQLT